jgi:DNA-binding MarR family transcriptional regulator
MNRKPAVPKADRTPLAQLSEGAMHAIVGYQIAQAAIVTDQVFDERVGQPGGLRRVDVTARQLARALAVTPPNIAIWIDRLQTRGLVARTRSESDARVQHIRLTRAGAALVDRTAQSLLAAEQAALSALSAAERAMLVELLHKVALSRRRGDG